MNHYPVISDNAMREWEAAAIHGGHSASALMEEAGAGAATWIHREYPEKKSVVIWVGKGNNGGDGLVVARLLALMKWNVTVWLAFEPEMMSELASGKLREFTQVVAGGCIKILHSCDAAPLPDQDGLLVDALLGTGLNGALRSPLAEAVQRLNAARKVSNWDVVALDVPSGLNESTLHADDAVVADLTITFGFPKSILSREDKADWTGRLEIIPLTGADWPAGATEMVNPNMLAAAFPRRKSMTNKGTHGRVVIVGGSHGFTGAPTLAALGALRAGAGLVQIVTPEESRVEVACRSPSEIMVSGWTSHAQVLEFCAKASAVVVGPGMGTDDETSQLLQKMLEHCECPMVLDADAITLLAKFPDWKSWIKKNRVLTPHPGEAARLLGRKVSPADREAAVEELTHEMPGGLILKGSRTLIALAGRLTLVNSTGNPGLAKGGTGDVLSGVLGAMLAQGIALRESMALSVWLHGRAADLLLKTDAMESLLASDVAHGIGAAMVDLRSRSV